MQTVCLSPRPYYAEHGIFKRATSPKSSFLTWNYCMKHNQSNGPGLMYVGGNAARLQESAHCTFFPFFMLNVLNL